MISALLDRSSTRLFKWTTGKSRGVKQPQCRLQICMQRYGKLQVRVKCTRTLRWQKCCQFRRPESLSFSTFNAVFTDVELDRTHPTPSRKNAGRERPQAQRYPCHAVRCSIDGLKRSVCSRSATPSTTKALLRRPHLRCGLKTVPSS